MPTDHDADSTPLAPEIAPESGSNTAAPPASDPQEVSAPGPAVPPGPGPLTGRVVRLDRTTAADTEELFAALDDERVFAGYFHGGRRFAGPEDVAEWIASSEVAGRAMYAARLIADSALGTAGQLVGSSTLGDIDLANQGIHLGWTAYAPAVWRTAVNTECKLLLLGHAFDDCGFERVKIQTDVLNTRSQAAIAALGATREGVLRHHRRRADGSWRDTVVFSILSAEWPGVRERLARRVTERLAAQG